MNIIFNGPEHEKAYYDQLESCKVHDEDLERKSLIYCLTISESLRRNFDGCYDRNKDTSGAISLEYVNEGYACTSDLKCIRLGFNLYSGRVPTAFDLEGEAEVNELKRNTPLEIFCDQQYRPYFIQALKIRFGE